MGTLYVVMGQSGSRKSATIRALTGFTDARGNPWQVAGRNGEPMSVFVIPTSPQENRDSFYRALARIAQEGIAWDVLLALHPDERAQGYIQRIPEVNKRETRWALLGMAVDTLPRDLHGFLSDPGVVIRDSRHRPANAIAHEIRTAWDWL